VLLCSHEHERAAGLSDRVIWLAGGQVVEEPVGVA
jgi:ABC-type glutathione transport system ATPase component